MHRAVAAPHAELARPESARLSASNRRLSVLLGIAGVLLAGGGALALWQHYH